MKRCTHLVSRYAERCGVGGARGSPPTPGVVLLGGVGSVDDAKVIRIRRLPSTRVLRRRRYEVSWSAGELGEATGSKVTTSPLGMLDPVLGVGDAWSVIDAADRAWDGRVGAWASLYED